MLGNGKISGDDVQTDTSGQQDEYFDQQANSTDIRWTVNDTFSIKYIFGYTDYFYDRTSDTELTSNTNTFTPGDVAGVPVTFSGDRQFYVSQETEYISHELQFFNDWTDSLTTTTGLFYYQAAITQRGDFYNSNDLNPGATPGVCCAPGQSKFVFELQLRGGGADRGDRPRCRCGRDSWASYRRSICSPRSSRVWRRGRRPFRLPGLSNAFCFPVAFNNNPFQLCAGQWAADNGDRVAHGPITYGTNLEYQTRSEREAFAVYTQSVYTLNEHFALTLGARWARDQLHGEENLFTYVENLGFAGGDLPSAQLTAMNVAIGAMDANGQILDYNNLRTAGLPVPSRCGGSCIARTTRSPVGSTSTGRRTIKICCTSR